MSTVSRAVWAAALSVSCLTPQGLPALLDGPRTVEAERLSRWPVAAHLPTDVAVLGEDIVVLDSQLGRLLRVTEAGSAPLLEDPRLQGTTRLSLAEDGVWISHPEGRFLRVGPGGTVAEQAALEHTGPGAGCRAVAVVERESSLLVGCTDGRILDQPRAGGAPALHATVPLQPTIGALLTDLQALPDGTLAAVDLHQPGVHLLSEGAAPLRSAGRHGLWVDAWSQPRAVAAAPGNALVMVDRELEVVQALSLEQGQALGALAEDGELLRPEAVAAVRAGKELDELLVLQGEPAEVWTLRLTAAAVAEAEARAGVKALRHMLSEPRAAGEEQTCAQCHDGVVTDGREVFDAELLAHPVHKAVDPAHVDAALPLGPGDTLVCTTCHSPHGGEGAMDFLREAQEADELCMRCHGENAHETAILRAESPGGVHPSGAALARATPGSPDPGTTGCTSCHAPHGAQGSPLLRHAADDGGCLSCHADQGSPATNHPLPASEEGPAGCRACHDLVGGQSDALLRHPGGSCGDCHGELAGALSQGHGTLARKGDAGCADCHAVHGGAARASLLSRPQAPCLQCHEDPAENILHHGSKAPACTDCHGAHDAATVVRDCGDCHEAEQARHAGAAHRALDCLACHPAHDDSPVRSADETCARCHRDAGQDAPQLTDLDHPPLVEGDALPRWDALQGLVLYDARGREVAAQDGGALTCRSCHWSHGAPVEGRDGHGLMRGGLGPACSACHGEEALLLLRGFHKPRGGTP